ncbi:MAG: AMP-dependent synthetase/ligase [Blastocatellia bacterium]
MNLKGNGSNFLERIWEQLTASRDRSVIQEILIREGEESTEKRAATGEELLARVGIARRFLRQLGIKPGERCGLLAANGLDWVALDLAMMAEGIVVVPLYARQAPAELGYMLRDCGATLVCCGTPALREGLAAQWVEAPPRMVVFDEIFATGDTGESLPPIARADDSLVTIIYTSGTSGEPKGVMLTMGNINHMVPCTLGRLDQLMEGRTSPSQPDQIFHYLPFCFAGSWILLLTALSRTSLLSLSMDLNRLAEELKVAAPNYCLNVPTLLERIRTGVEGQIASKPALIQTIYGKGKAAWIRRQEGRATGSDWLWEALARRLLFRPIRGKIGPALAALICGSAPLSRETQLFFLMLGIRVLQVYGLTETTAICTMDDPRNFRPGRVGPAIPGIEMRLGEGDEILVRGPNLFPGYWNRPTQTAAVLQEGWFRTGDQGAIDEAGNWSIIGRLKNLLILNSGHNVAPEPIEEKILNRLPTAAQCIVFGNDRSFLTALITGPISRDEIEAALGEVNQELPHYKRVLGFHHEVAPLTIESGLLTANGKVKRDGIATAFGTQINALYDARRTD